MSAGHIAGANIEHRCIGGGQFEITLNIFRDCQEVDLPASLPIKWISECSNTTFGSINLLFIPSESEEVSQLCSSNLANSSCVGGTEPGMFKKVYRATWTPPASCDVWRIQFLDCNRAQTLNIFDPDNDNCVVVYNRLFSQTGACNDSPVISAQQIPYVCVGADVDYNFGAYDNDGDSLSFSLIPASSAVGNNPFFLPYEAGYSGMEPIPGATIDPVTGQISFTPTISGRFTFVVLIEQFDENGMPIGSVIFDLLFNVLACPTGPPESVNSGLTNFMGSAQQTGDLSVEMCFGEDFCADFSFSSPEPSAELVIESNIADILPGGTISVTGTNPAVGTICWTATEGSLGGTLLLSASDDLCPIPGIVNVGIAIDVITSVYGGPDTTICPGVGYQFNAIGSTDYVWSTLAGDPIVVGTNFSCNNCPNPIATPAQSTTYLLTGAGAVNQCSNTDVITLSFGTPVADAGPDDDVCGNTYTLNASPPEGVGSWLGGPGGSVFLPNNNDPNATVTVPGPGPHTFFWQDDAGGGCVDTDQVTITFTNFPIADAGSNFSICGFADSLHANATPNGDSQWIWDDPNVNVTNPLDPNSPVSASVFGTYTFTWVEDNNGCTDSADVDVTFIDFVEAQAGVDRSFCENSGILLGLNDYAEGSWNYGALPISIDDWQDPNATVTNLGGPGTFPILFETGVGGSCTDVDTMLVTFETLAIADAGPDLEFCSLAGGDLSAGSSANGVSHWQYDPSEVTLTDDFDPNASVSAPATGTFELIWIEEQSPCMDQDTALVTFDNTPAADAGEDITVCNTSANLSANGAINDGVWTIVSGAVGIADVNDPNTSINVLSPNQTVELQWTLDATACVTSDNIIIEFLAVPDADAGPNVPNACGNQITMDADPSAGVGVWSTSTISPAVTIDNINDPNTTITVDGPGQVDLTWTETIVNGNCSDSDDVSITFSVQPDANASPDDDACGTQYQLNAIASVTSGFWFGAPGTTFENGDNQSPDAIINVPGAGVYEFVWSEVNGFCSDQDTVLIEFFDTPDPSAGADAQVCSDEFDLEATNVIGMGTWTVMPNDVVFSNGANAAVTTATSTSYGLHEFIWTETAASCSGADTIVVEFIEQPLAFAGNDTSICALQLPMDPVPSAGTGLWSTLDPEITFSDATLASTLVTATGAGVYTLTWTETNSICSDFDDIVVSFVDTQTADAGEDQDVCGLSTSLDASTSFGTGEWTPHPDVTFVDVTDPNSEITSTTYGDMVLEWTESNPVCAAVDQVTIRFIEIPNPNAGADAEFCGLSGDVSAIASIGDGQWTGAVNFDSPTSGTSTFSSAATYGEFELVWTETNEICVLSDTVLVTLYEPTLAEAGEDGIICGMTTALVAIPSVGSGLWTIAAGVTATDLTDPNTEVTVTSPGMYDFTWTESNGTCSDSETISLEFFTVPMSDAGPDTSFCGLNGQVFAQLGAASGSWTFPVEISMTDDTDPNTFLTSSAPGDYTLAWTEANGGLCDSSDDMVITFLEEPIADAGEADSICGLSYEITGMTNAGVGTWEVLGGLTVSNPNAATTMLTAAAFGTYQVVWHVDNAGCVDSDTTSITFIESPTANAGPDQIVCGDETAMAAVPSLGTGDWEFPFILQVNNINSPEMTVDGFGNFGVYQFIWTETFLGCSSSDTMLLEFIDSPLADAGPDQNICGLSTFLDAELTTGTGTWIEFPAGSTIDVNDPNSEVSVTAFGEVFFIWEEVGNGCSTRDSVFVNFIETPTANAGADVSVCGLNSAIEAIPSFGTGEWLTNPDVDNPSQMSAIANVEGDDFGLYEMVWMESQGACTSTDTMLLNLIDSPLADAGLDQNICGLETNLAATLSTGTGVWSIVSGSADILTTSDPISMLTSTSFGTVTLVWQESDAMCFTTDTVSINFIETPNPNAGSDVQICGLVAEISAIPSFGVGEWVTNPDVGNPTTDAATSEVTGNDFGDFEMVWMETEGICSATDTMLLTLLDSPIANAGNDEDVCGQNASLGAVLSTGSGTWIDLPAIATITDINDPESTVSSTTYGPSTFVWEESDGNCSTTDTVIINFIEIPNAEAGPDQELCGTFATLNAGPSVGDGIWTSAQGADFGDDELPNSSVTAPDFGTFTLVWTETNGGICSQSDDVEITFLPSPIADAGEDDAICGTNYTLDATLSTGSGVWTVPFAAVDINDVNDENAVIDVPMAGVYDFVWTESSADCFTTDTVTVTFLDTPTSDAGPDLEFCGNSGTLEANASIGTGNWTGPSAIIFSASDNPNSNVTGPPGTYALTWSEVNGGTCSSQDEMLLTLWEIPDSDAGPDDDVCGTSYQLNAIPSAGTGTWTGIAGVTFSPSPNSPNATVTVPDCGLYTFQWSEENDICTDFDQVDIQFNCNPDTSDVSIFCINGNTAYQLSFDISGGDAGSYVVTGDPGNIGGSSFLSDPIPTGSPYSFFVTDQFACDAIEVSGQFACESLSDAGTMSQDTLHACAGDLATAVYNNDAFLDPNDNLTYVLHDQSGNALGTIFATNDLAATFGLQPSMNEDEVYFISSVVGDDNGGGSVDFTSPGISVAMGTPVIFHSSPTANIDDGEAVLCEGQETDIEISFDGASPFSVTYDYNSVDFELNGIASNSFTFSADEAGDVTLLTMSDAYCTGQVNGSLNIVVYEIPTVTMPDTLRTCSDDPDAVPVELTGNGPWSFDLYIDSDFSSSYSLDGLDSSFPTSNSGSYEIVSLSDQFCSATDTVQIGIDVIQSPPALAGSDVVLCQGENVDIGETEIDGYVYVWTMTDQLNSLSIAQPTVSINNPSGEPVSEQFELSVTNDICTTIDQATVTVNPLPIDFGINGTDSICEGETVTLIAFGGTSYEWLSGQEISNPLIDAPSISPETDSEYLVEISNQYSCSVTDSLFVTVSPLPEVNSMSSNASGCTPLTVTWLNLTPENSIASCEWTTNGGLVLSDSCSQLVVEYTVPGDYTVELNVTSPEGCSSSQLSPDTVSVTGAFAEILYHPQEPTIDDPWIQAVDGTDPDATLWDWTIDGESVSNLANPILTFDSTEAAVYEVCLAVISQNGCPDTTCVEVEVGTNFLIHVPLAFTPNGDKLNDVFKPVINHPEDLNLYEFRIYDRRGHIKFETERFNWGWDGINVRDNGIMQGTYQWEIVYRTNSNFRIKKIRGHFELLK